MAYKHVIRAKTKNLLNISDKTQTVNGVTITISGNLITLNGTATVYTEILCNITSVTLTESCAFSFEYRSGDILNYTGVLTLYNHIYDKEIRYPATSITEVVPTTATNALSVRFSRGVSFKNFSYYLQLEQGSTPTTYTPYNYLQSNKRMIKVSDVCQVLNKEEFLNTKTVNGLTFTNNADGSITLNGTPTENIYVDLLQTRYFTDIIPTHKYLISGMGKMAIFMTLGGSPGAAYYADTIITCNKTLTFLEMRTYPTVAFSNYTVKPQLFDLTEMYGAGNEPKTVAEFREKFPNELYNYSPKCWLTSYRNAVVCKTKNLFDYKTSDGKTESWQDITLTLNADYFELSGKQQAGKYIELGQSGFNIPFEVGKSYVLSADVKVPNFRKVFMRAQYTDGESPQTEWETVSWDLTNGKIVKVFTPTRLGYFDKITFFNPGDAGRFSGDYIIRIQLEQGSTATSYVPYQHI